MFVGIDPGQKGGICALRDDKIFLYPMPKSVEDYAPLLKALTRHKITHLALEKAQAVSGNGGKSLFTYGSSWGCLRGVIMALDIKHSLVPPKTWQKTMFVGASAEDPKAKAYEVARRLAPEESFIPKGCRTPHDGIVDAFLIASWARRNH